jgi:hypothetical protein
MRRDLLLGGFGQAVPQVPAVTGLDRAGQRPPDRLGVGTGPVPAHDLGTRVLTQPCLHHVSRPAGQDIDPFPGPGVDQDGCVDVAAAQREIVSAQHAGHADLRQGQPQQYAQRGVPRDRDSQHCQQPGAGTAG